MAPFDDSLFDKRAKQLWDTHIEPLSHADREMLRDLLHDYFHSHE